VAGISLARASAGAVGFPVLQGSRLLVHRRERVSWI
jgi:hypothetical protein